MLGDAPEQRPYLPSDGKRFLLSFCRRKCRKSFHANKNHDDYREGFGNNSTRQHAKHLSKIHGNQAVATEREGEAADRLTRRWQQSTVSLLRIRPRLWALMNTSLQRCFHMAAEMPHQHVGWVELRAKQG